MHFKTKHSFILVIAISTMVFGITSSCKDDKKIIKTTEVPFTKEGELTLYKSDTDSIVSQLEIEIADNEYETQTGLMYRTSMKENQGMLFVFEDERPRSFYMKNTQFALDLIYLDTNKFIVSFQENAQPLDESSLPSNAAAKYVLEVNAGLVNKWQLEVGDKMMYSNE
ncbi:DUF192 domain-containing protein [Xanthomarina sp. F2636L]|uniref:DUF192 domain-containing protein n=1 Tax=Xanthomarina sp. F2636L TaxID=2996018 RepID=UPI00225E3EA5|nr:DUF192 domain-containing protein [Xanthomarina sp. F2636L]MCX7551988.1 DUF192 domain-containing protein [Xanthomarina sp. F2636L]